MCSVQDDNCTIERGEGKQADMAILFKHLIIIINTFRHGWFGTDPPVCCVLSTYIFSWVFGFGKVHVNRAHTWVNTKQTMEKYINILSTYNYFTSPKVPQHPQSACPPICQIMFLLPLPPILMEQPFILDISNISHYILAITSDIVVLHIKPNHFHLGLRIFSKR